MEQLAEIHAHLHNRRSEINRLRTFDQNCKNLREKAASVSKCHDGGGGFFRTGVSGSDVLDPG